MNPAVTAIILTRDEAVHIADCIESLRWTDGILVFDSFSSDTTVKIATEAGAVVLQHAFENYTKQRNAALEAVKTTHPDSTWVLFVDADERSSPEQGAEIRACMQDATIVGYWVPRHNYIFGKLTRHTGWYPDYQLRLLKIGKSRYDPTREVHETVLLDGPDGHLKTPFVHYNYRDVRQFVGKQEKYTAYAAREMYLQGVRVKPQNFILQPIRHFWWRYVTLQGYRDGFHGLRLSLLMAWYEFKKYVFLSRES